MTTEQESRPVSLCDWKSPEPYPKGELISMRQWAWEFLRRNPKYQVDWADYCKKWREVTPGWDPGQPFPDDQKLEDAIFAAEDDEKLWVEELRQDGGIIKITIEKWYGQRHGLANFPNPLIADLPFAQKPEFDGAPKAIQVINPGEKYTEPAVLSRYVLMEFDLSEQLDMQLEVVARVLKGRQERLIHKGVIPALSKNRKSVDLYPFYLRVLDANAAKVSRAKMAEVFSLERPDVVSDGDINNWIKVAEKLASDGYRNLARMPS